MALPFFCSYLLISLLGIIVTLSGTCLVDICLKKINLSNAIKFSIGYFLGITFFISCWRLLEFILKSAKLSGLLTFFIALALASLCIHKYFSSRNIFLKDLLLLLPLNLASHVFCTTFWSREVFEDSFSTIGSGHSPRFANIALHLIDTDRIPILGMNYAQSLLSAFPSFLGLKFPLLFLSLWLGLSLFMVILLSYYLLRHFRIGKVGSFFTVFFILAGNTAFSFSHVLVLDLGSPIGVLAYADSFHSIGSLIVSAILLYELWHFEKKQFPFFLILLSVLVLFSDIIMAPQTMTVVLACAGLLFLRSLGTIKKLPVRARNLAVFIILAFVCVIASTRTGGFLTPSRYHTTSVIPGVQKIEGSDFRLNFSPSIPYYLGNYRGWGAANEDASFFRLGETTGDQAKRLFKSIFEIFEILFFPVFGLILFSIFGRSLLHSKELLFLSLASFLVGFILVWPVALCDIKWPQVRFLLPFIYLGQILFMVSIWTLTPKNNLMIKNISLGIIALIASWGPLKNIYPILNDNLVLDREGYKSRLKILVDYTEMPTTDKLRDPFVCHKK